MIRLQEWAAARWPAAALDQGPREGRQPADGAGRGGRLHDWPPRPGTKKRTVDTNHKRVLDYALHPDRIRTSWIGGRPHLFDIAFAWLLARRRKEMASSSRCCSGWRRVGRGGQARGQGLLLYTLAAPGRVRRGDRLPDPPARGGRQPGELHVRGVRPARRQGAVRAEKDRFRPPWRRWTDPCRRRTGPRTAGSHRLDKVAETFHNVADTDPALLRERGLEPGDPGPLRPVPSATTWSSTTLSTPEQVETVIAGAVEAGAAGRADRPGARGPPAQGRGGAGAGGAGRAARGMAAEAGKTSTRAIPRCPRRSTSRTTTRRWPRRWTTWTVRAQAGPAHRGHPAVELPARDPGRVDAVRAGRRIGRRGEAGVAGTSYRVGDGWTRCGRPAYRATCCGWSSSPSTTSAGGWCRTRGDRPILTGAYETPSCSGRSASDPPLLAETAARTRSSTPARTSTSR